MEKTIYICDNCGTEVEDKDRLDNKYHRQAHGVIMTMALSDPGDGKNQWCVKCRNEKFKEIVAIMHNWSQQGEL